METMFIWVAIGTAASLVAMPKLAARLMLSRAKHRSLAGHSRMARRVARQLPFYDFGPEKFFVSTFSAIFPVAAGCSASCSRAERPPPGRA